MSTWPAIRTTPPPCVPANLCQAAPKVNGFGLTGDCDQSSEKDRQTAAGSKVTWFWV